MVRVHVAKDYKRRAKRRLEARHDGVWHVAQRRNDVGQRRQQSRHVVQRVVKLRGIAATDDSV